MRDKNSSSFEKIHPVKNKPYHIIPGRTLGTLDWKNLPLREPPNLQKTPPFYFGSPPPPPTIDIHDDDKSFDAPYKLITNLEQGGKEIIIIGNTNCYLQKPKESHTRRLKHLYYKFQFSHLIQE